jgi:glyoxylase-like metal-dependent hydrolase (beta-lactamase superfamily II)
MVVIMLQRRQFLGGAAVAATWSALPFSTAWAQNAPDFGTPTLPTPGFARQKVGDIEVIAVNDGIVRRALTEEFVRNAPIAQVKEMLGIQNLPLDYIDIPFNAFALVMGGQRILIDTGLGEFGPPTTGKLLANLAAAGLQPGDISAVLISHYHGDHIGGLRRRDGSWTFPNAKVYVPAPEHAFWMDDAKMNAAPEAARGTFQGARRVFADMPADKLVRFEPGTPLVAGITSIAAYGHTPGHTLFETVSAGRTFTYLADLTNVPALFARNPDWAVQFDMDAEAARKVRRDMFARVVASGAMVGGFHFPFPAFGRIATSGNGYAFQPVGG